MNDTDPGDQGAAATAGADAGPEGGGGQQRSPQPWLLGLALILLVAGAAGWLWTTTRAKPDGQAASTESAGGRQRLEGFGEIRVVVTAADGDEHEACLLLAESSDQRQRGLMEVTDTTLGGYDGMLFDFGRESSSGFWMRNTPMALSIAFFEAAGSLVSTADMEPCGDMPSCPVYPAGGIYRYAVEAPQGRLGELGIKPRATLAVGSRSCPPA